MAFDLKKIEELSKDGDLKSSDFWLIFSPCEDEDGIARYETYGEEFKNLKEKLSELSDAAGTQPYQHVWTVVDSGGEDVVALNGWHSANRLYYITCKNPWGDGSNEDSKISISADF